MTNTMATGSMVTDPDQMSIQLQEEVMRGEMDGSLGPEVYDLNAFERQAHP